MIAQQVLNDPGHGSTLTNMRDNHTFNERAQNNILQNNLMQNLDTNDNFKSSITLRMPKQSDDSLTRNIYDQSQDKPQK